MERFNNYTPNDDDSLTKAYDKLTTFINNTTNDNSKTITRTKDKKIIPKHIIRLLDEKKTLVKEVAKSKSTEDKNKLNNLNVKIKKDLQSFRATKMTLAINEFQKILVPIL
jgi:hypothetical protein